MEEGGAPSFWEKQEARMSSLAETRPAAKVYRKDKPKVRFAETVTCYPAPTKDSRPPRVSKFMERRPAKERNLDEISHKVSGSRASVFTTSEVVEREFVDPAEFFRNLDMTKPTHATTTPTLPFPKATKLEKGDHTILLMNSVSELNCVNDLFTSDRLVHWEEVLSQCDNEKIEQMQKELISKLGEKNCEFLRDRYKGKQQSDREETPPTGESEVSSSGEGSSSSSSPKQSNNKGLIETYMSELKAAAGSGSLSDPKTVNAIMEMRFSEQEARKLEWTNLLDDKKQSADEVAMEMSLAGLRFDFDGNLMYPYTFSPECSEETVSRGLHCHGLSPEAPGYSLPEIVQFFLGSKNRSQMIIGLRILIGILRNRRRIWKDQGRLVWNQQGVPPGVLESLDWCAESKSVCSKSACSGFGLGIVRFDNYLFKSLNIQKRLVLALNMCNHEQAIHLVIECFVALFNVDNIEEWHSGVNLFNVALQPDLLPSPSRDYRNIPRIEKKEREEFFPAWTFRDLLEPASEFLSCRRSLFRADELHGAFTSEFEDPKLPPPAYYDAEWLFGSVRLGIFDSSRHFWTTATDYDDPGSKLIDSPDALQLSDPILSLFGYPPPEMKVFSRENKVQVWSSADSILPILKSTMRAALSRSPETKDHRHLLNCLRVLLCLSYHSDMASRLVLAFWLDESTDEASLMKTFFWSLNKITDAHYMVFVTNLTVVSAQLNVSLSQLMPPDCFKRFVSIAWNITGYWIHSLATQNEELSIVTEDSTAEDSSLSPEIHFRKELATPQLIAKILKLIPFLSEPASFAEESLILSECLSSQACIRVWLQKKLPAIKEMEPACRIVEAIFECIFIQLQLDRRAALPCASFALRSASDVIEWIAQTFKRQDTTLRNKLSLLVTMTRIFRFVRTIINVAFDPILIDETNSRVSEIVFDDTERIWTALEVSFLNPMVSSGLFEDLVNHFQSLSANQEAYPPPFELGFDANDRVLPHGLEFDDDDMSGRFLHFMISAKAIHEMLQIDALASNKRQSSVSPALIVSLKSSLLSSYDLLTNTVMPAPSAVCVGDGLTMKGSSLILDPIARLGYTLFGDTMRRIFIDMVGSLETMRLFLRSTTKELTDMMCVLSSGMQRASSSINSPPISLVCSNPTSVFASLFVYLSSGHLLNYVGATERVLKEWYEQLLTGDMIFNDRCLWLSLGFCLTNIDDDVVFLYPPITHWILKLLLQMSLNLVQMDCCWSIIQERFLPRLIELVTKKRCDTRLDWLRTFAVWLFDSYAHDMNLKAGGIHDFKSDSFWQSSIFLELSARRILMKKLSSCWDSNLEEEYRRVISSVVEMQRRRLSFDGDAMSSFMAWKNLRVTFDEIVSDSIVDVIGSNE